MDDEDHGPIRSIIGFLIQPFAIIAIGVSEMGHTWYGWDRDTAFGLTLVVSLVIGLWIIKRRLT